MAEGEPAAHSVTVPNEPQHPELADVELRIQTYFDWPHTEPAPTQLAECGFFHSGLFSSDEVTCFFCGGTVKNWKPSAKPWKKHSKFFPDCPFLAKKASPNPTTEPINKELPTETQNIQQAADIVPQDLVQGAVKRKNESAFPSQELRETVLEVPQDQNVSRETVCSGSAFSTDQLLCKPKRPKIEVVKLQEMSSSTGSGRCQASSLKIEPGMPMAERGRASPSVSASYEPKRPKMEGDSLRILVDSDRPPSEPSPSGLASSDLLYSGVAEEVICPSCGTTLKGRELHDTPSNGYKKFCPQCLAPIQSNTNLPNETEIIRQAMEIFPEDLVRQAVKVKKGSGFSLEELCDTILGLPQQQNAPRVVPQETICPVPDSSADRLLCQMCMETEREVVFQPCGHLVSC